ncbi:MDR family MFS transporter [Streptomyces roseifaciens]|uniref:MDR family MFS transporter n=1 Tax=Streptomyces roseifaciens TaxID=1488406 RepID=UPI000717F668|nr:MDR family MFS transporter [Streptomyces roseifaciens]
MTDTAAAPGSPGAPVIDRRRMRLVMAGLMLGLFMSALDQTIISAALRTIADDLNGLSQQAWANTSYMITSVITTALYGKLSDIYGRRPLYVIAVTVFVVGSVLCGLAQSMVMLSVFRGIQGLGAGGLMSLAFAILADLLPPAERSRYQAWFGAVFGVSAVVGPVVGGFFAGLDSFAGAAGWRWAFFINVPIGIATVLIVLSQVRVQNDRSKDKPDIAGVITLVLFLVPVLFAVEEGPKWGWGSAGTLGLFAVGAVGLVLFVMAQRRAGGAALLPTPMFRSPVFTLYNAVNTIVGAAVFGSLAVLPLYLQIVKGLSPTQAGLMMLPQTFGIIVAGRLCSAYVTRTGRFKGAMLTGIVLIMAGTFWFATFGADTALWQPAAAAAVMGIGIGVCWQVMLVAIQRGLEPQYMGAGIGSFAFFRSIGGTVGISVFFSLFFGSVGGRISDAYAGAASDPGFKEALADPSVTSQPANQTLLAGRNGAVSLDDSSFLAHADARLAHPFLEGMAQAMQTVYLVSGFLLALGLVMALIPRDRRPEADAATAPSAPSPKKVAAHQ